MSGPVVGSSRTSPVLVVFQRAATSLFHIEVSSREREEPPDFRTERKCVDTNCALHQPCLFLRKPQAKAERAAAEAKALRDQGILMTDDAAPLAGNPNRKGGGLGEDDDWASGIDAALGSMSMGSGAGAADTHPEKRLKAVSFRGEGTSITGTAMRREGASHPRRCPSTIFREDMNKVMRQSFARQDLDSCISVCTLFSVLLFVSVPPFSFLHLPSTGASGLSYLG